MADAMVGPMASSAALVQFGDIVPAAERPSCWWALLVGAPPALPGV